MHLLEACFRGELPHSSRSPQNVPSVIWHGNIFIWKPSISGIEAWNDKGHWNNFRKEGEFWYREDANGSGVMKKSITVYAFRHFHNFVTYFNPESPERLILLSQCPKIGNLLLRAELASMHKVILVYRLN